MEVKFVDLGSQYLPLREEILAKFDEISRAGNYILGPDVTEFEKNFAALCGVKYAISMGNGSDALMLPLLCLGIGPGDEVIAPPNSFVATAWVIARTGAKIVFADVGNDYNIDPDKIEAAITPRTKAIMPVHLTGRICDMDRIMAIARKHNLLVIEDAAQAVGAKYRGKRAGSFGISAGFSLHPLKNLHVHGDGGVAVTDNVELYELLCKYRNHGLRNRDECEFWGVNTRLDSIQAAIGNIKLQHLDTWNSRFREIAKIYTDGLMYTPSLTVPTHADHEEPVYHRYVIQHQNRDALSTFLKERGIETKVNYPIPLHLQEAARNLGYMRGDFPVAERLAGVILSLPIYPELTNEQAYYVVDQIRDFKP